MVAKPMSRFLDECSMNFHLSDEQKRLAQQARGLLTQRVPFDALVASRVPIFKGNA